MSSAYPCTQPLANLRPPLVPQVFNGVVNTLQIDLAGGLYIQIPPYPDVEINDIIYIFFSSNDQPIIGFIILELPGLPRSFLLPTSVATVGQHYIYYVAMDSAGNSSISEKFYFQIVQSLQVNNLLRVTVISNGAAADGVSQNIVMARLTNSDGYPAVGESLQVWVIGIDQYPRYVVTDSSGSAYIPFTSLQAGVFTVTISLASDSAISTSVDIVFSASNQSICR